MRLPAKSTAPVLPRSPAPLGLHVPVVSRHPARSMLERSLPQSPFSRFDRNVCIGRPRGLDGTFILDRLAAPASTASMALLSVSAVLRVSTSHAGRWRLDAVVNLVRGGDIASSLVGCFDRRSFVALIGTAAQQAR